MLPLHQTPRVGPEGPGLYCTAGRLTPPPPPAHFHPVQAGIFSGHAGNRTRVRELRQQGRLRACSVFPYLAAEGLWDRRQSLRKHIHLILARAPEEWVPRAVRVLTRPRYPDFWRFCGQPLGVASCRALRRRRASASWQLCCDRLFTRPADQPRLASYVFAFLVDTCRARQQRSYCTTLIYCCQELNADKG